MKIDVIRLKENVNEDFQESVTAEGLDLDTSEVKYKGDISISSQVRKEMSVLYTKTHFTSVAEFTCSRCLKSFEHKIDNILEVTYPLDKTQQFVDILEDVREEVILGYPLKFLCKPDCLGFCHKCGQNLNEAKCSCKSGDKKFQNSN
jgi:uncharacterized metal-binding protein YceD (DUF177 family)